MTRHNITCPLTVCPLRQHSFDINTVKIRFLDRVLSKDIQLFLTHTVFLNTKVLKLDMITSDSPWPIPRKGMVKKGCQKLFQHDIYQTPWNKLISSTPTHFLVFILLVMPFLFFVLFAKFLNSANSVGNNGMSNIFLRNVEIMRFGWYFRKKSLIKLKIW